MQPPPQQNSMSLENTLKQFMTQTDAIFQNQAASIRNLEVQIGQLSNLINTRPQGALPSQTEINPREQVQAVTLRSGKELIEPMKKEPTQAESKEEKGSSTRQQALPSAEKVKTTSKLFPENPPPYVPPLPFPQRFQKLQIEKQFEKFLEVFKKLHINIPFADALAQMPSYFKFMKEILSNKRKLEDFETVALTEECSAILQKKLPPKLRDPGSFTIPCTIGNSYIGKALCDLGASVNLMPLSVYKNLGLGEAKPTTVSLQLADRSITYPRGIIEDVLVKVDKFIFPADFIVLDMEEDQEIPIILGRPFLATCGAEINVPKGKLTLRVEDDTVVFDVFKPFPTPQRQQEGLVIDIKEDHVQQPSPGVDCTLKEPSVTHHSILDLNTFIPSEQVSHVHGHGIGSHLSTPYIPYPPHPPHSSSLQWMMAENLWVPPDITIDVEDAGALNPFPHGFEHFTFSASSPNPS
jgi:hypothetical protein